MHLRKGWPPPAQNGAQIEQSAGVWTLRTDKGDHFRAPIVINAAGSWADDLAKLARVQPLCFQPMRRTIITFDAPPGTDLNRLPFAKTVGDQLYFAHESGRLFASPMDEVPSDPTDAQPEEYEIALAALRMEERTTVKVRKIHSKWAGLRTFTRDRHPAVGFASDAEGFFWLAGQGGFGLQSSPAMAAVVECLIARAPWPFPDVPREALLAGRFLRQAA